MRKAPKIFESLKKEALGSDYELSVAFVSPEEIARLNKIYRGIDAPTDILSFPLSDSEGEIYICEEEARKESMKFGRGYDNFLQFLFIHGCVHLKGYDHSDTMERVEAGIREKFKV